MWDFPPLQTINMSFWSALQETTTGNTGWRRDTEKYTSYKHDKKDN